MNNPLLAATLMLPAAAHLLEPARSAAAPAGTATARFNPSTGTMVLDLGSGLAVLGIVSDGNVITGLTHSPPPQKLDQSVIAYVSGSGLTFETVRLENAFVTGLTPKDFIFSYVPIGADIVVADVTIPESNSLAIGLVGASSAVRRRTRRYLD